MKRLPSIKGSLFIALLSILFFASCSDGATYVIIETEYGDMKVELYNSTPIHKENFVKLVKESFYDSLIFHRIIPGFMIQGGDPQSKNSPAGTPLGMGGPGYTLDAEIGSPHFKGTLAAARTGDAGNPERKSSGSQFYIVQGSLQSDDMLNSWQSRKGFQYNEAQREKYRTIGGTPQLDGDYTVFGEVVKGMEVIDKIVVLERDNRDRPLKDVIMKIKMAN